MRRDGWQGDRHEGASGKGGIRGIWQTTCPTAAAFPCHYFADGSGGRNEFKRTLQ